MALPKIIKLNGGATLLYKHRKINKATAFVMNFEAGAQCDGELPGICHFAEHLSLKETKNLTLAQTRELHQKLATQMNGSTGREQINFMVCCANSKLEEGVKLLCEEVFEPGFNEKSFETEKQVVYKEIVKLLDNDSVTAYLQLMRTALPNAYYATDIVGTQESLEKITMQDMHEFASNYLTPQNLIVCVAGNISKTKAKKLVNKHVLSKIADRKLKELPKLSFDFADKSKLVVTTNNRQNAHIHLLFPMQREKAREDNYISGPANYLLNGYNGLVFKILRDELGLIYGAGAAFVNNKKFAYFAVDIQTSPDKINKCIEGVAEIFSRLKMTDDKLKEFKDRDKIIEDKKMPMGLYDSAFGMHDSYKYYGNFAKEKRYQRWLKRVNTQDVNDFIAKIREQKKVFVSIVSNLPEKDIMPINKIEELFFN